MPGKIVVGTDFRAEADRAIDRAFCAAEEETDVSFLYVDDWYEVETQQYDLVIANDLFPNVDHHNPRALGLSRVLNQ